MFDEESVLYSNTRSEEINLLVQKDVAPHLFLICNYSPCPYYVQSEDAKFIMGILNLYKFSIDGSIVDKIIDIMNIDAEKREKNFKKSIKLIKSLRTVYCHNENEVNGNNADVKSVDEWMSKKPQNIEDYKALNEQLQGLASDIVNTLYEYIDEISQCQEKVHIIKRWEEAICKFYQRHNTSKILVGQLRKFYAARKGLTSIDGTDNYNLAKYVRKFYIGEMEDKIEQYKEILRKYKSNKKDQAAILNLIEQMENKIDNKKMEVISRLDKGSKDKNELDENYFLYLDSYIKEMPSKIISLIHSSDKSNEYGTLLPQDIVQFIVKQDFDAIMR